MEYDIDLAVVVLELEVIDAFVEGESWVLLFGHLGLLVLGGWLLLELFQRWIWLLLDI